MPRLFVAIELPSAVRDALAALMAETGRDHPVPGARWTPPDNLHVTLRFLGSVASADLPALQAALAQIEADGFALGLAGMGAFPDVHSRHPRVLWAGVTPLDRLRALKALVDRQLGPDPEGDLHPYTPHVTLARVDDDAAAALPIFVARHAALASAPWPVEHFTLYESKSTPRGPAYLPLRRFALR
jgi:2'-5' RNA ligase